MSSVIRKISNTQSKSNDGSFQLIIPKFWCEQNNLVHQDEVELHIDRIAPSTILIQLPGRDLSPPKTELVIDDTKMKSGQARRRAILGGYLEGYETIKLINVSRKSRERLSIRQDLHELTFKLDGCSTNEEERMFELTIATGVRSPIELLEKLFDTTRLMFEDVFKAYLNLDQVLSQDLIQRDDQADKLYFSIVRSLKLVLREPFKFAGDNFDLEDTLDYRMVASNLENLCDAAEYVAEAIVGENDGSHNIDASTINQLSSPERSLIRSHADVLIATLDEAYQCYKDNDENKAVEMSAQRIIMDQLIAELVEVGIHSSLLDVLDEAKETIVDLLELVHAEPEDD